MEFQKDLNIQVLSNILDGITVIYKLYYVVIYKLYYVVINNILLYVIVLTVS